MVAPERNSNAGMRPASATSRYGTFRKTAMMKPASPRTGGMIWPEVEATASIAPAMFGRNPRSFIIGMVRRPVSTTFATA